eukprot:COSAG06_NODE_991_length_11174_cov_3.912686_11_plen_179_part_00
MVCTTVRAGSHVQVARQRTWTTGGNAWRLHGRPIEFETDWKQPINTYIKTTTPLRIVPTHPHRKIPRNGRQWPFLACRDPNPAGFGSLHSRSENSVALRSPAAMRLAEARPYRPGARCCAPLPSALGSRHHHLLNREPRRDRRDAARLPAPSSLSIVNAMLLALCSAHTSRLLRRMTG